MGAHNAATLEYARRRVQFVIDALTARRPAHPATDYWVSELQAGLNQEPGGTLKAWMQARHESGVIDTLQVTVRLDGAEPIEITAPWVPGPRVVDASRAASVRLSGSTRDYAGVTTLTATDRVYIGFAKWGDDVQLLCYSA